MDEMKRDNLIWLTWRNLGFVGIVALALLNASIQVGRFVVGGDIDVPGGA